MHDYPIAMSLMYTLEISCICIRVRLAEWSKAPDLSSGTRKRAWVRTPHLTHRKYFFVSVFTFTFFLFATLPSQHFRIPRDNFQRLNLCECNCDALDMPCLCILEGRCQEAPRRLTKEYFYVSVRNEVSSHAERISEKRLNF